MNVKQRVQNIIKKCGTANPFEVARNLGIKITYGDLGGVRYANYLKYKRVKIIIIDNNVTPMHMLHFVLAHELGHAICTPDDNTAWLANYTIGNDKKTERIANQFAVELLLNDAYLADCSNLSIQDAAERLGVPVQLLFLKE